VANSTFAGNSATDGGIENDLGPVTVTNCTFSGNTASSGGAIYNSNATLTVNNSLLTGDTGGECAGGGCPTDGSNGNVVGVAANLAPLGWYGGATETMIPLPGTGSAAICAGSAALFFVIPGTTIPITTDQRGFADDTTCPSGTSYVDAGAVQTNYLIVNTTLDQNDTLSNCPIGSSGTCSLRDALNAANTSYSGGADIAFAPGVIGVINLSSALPSIGGNLDLVGPGAGNLTVSGGGSQNNVGSIFSVSPLNSYASAAFSGLTISNGYTINNMGGGGINAAGTVTLSNLTQTYTGAQLTPGVSTTPTGLGINWTNAPDTNAGSYTVTATVNNPNYQGSASGNFVIQPATARVSLSNLTQTYTGSALTPTATTSPASLSVAWAGAPDTKVGQYAVTATVNNPNYNSNAARGTFVIQQARPLINWPAPAPITYGAALSATQLLATANTPGTFTYMPAAGTVLRAGTQTLTVIFTPTDRTDYRSATASVTLMVNKATPVVTWATPAAIRYGTPLSSSQLNARASVAGSFVYKPGYGTVLGAGNQTLGATFTPADTGDYYNTTATVSITVNLAVLTVTATNAFARYNQPLPPLTYTVTGFVNGDKKSVLSGAPKESTTAKQGSLPGTYPITISQGMLSAANYTLKFVNGTLTITR